VDTTRACRLLATVTLYTCNIIFLVEHVFNGVAVEIGILGCQSQFKRFDTMLLFFLFLFSILPLLVAIFS